MTQRTILLSLALAPMAMWAQHISQGPLHSADDPRADWLLPGDTIHHEGQASVYRGKSQPLAQLATPAMSHNQQPSLGAEPTASGMAATQADSTWQQHISPWATYHAGWGYMGSALRGLTPGLHAAIDLSAFATLGGHAPHRGGFAQSISADYSAPLTRDGRLWMSAGGYLSNTTYGGDSYRDAGLYALLSYQLSPRWELYAYGQLSLVSSPQRYMAGMGYYGYPYGYAGWLAPFGVGHTAAGTPIYPGANIVGVGARYNVSKAFTIGVSVQSAWSSQSKPTYYFDQYNYPVPQP